MDNKAGEKEPLDVVSAVYRFIVGDAGFLNTLQLFLRTQCIHFVGVEGAVQEYSHQHLQIHKVRADPRPWARPCVTSLLHACLPQEYVEMWELHLGQFLAARGASIESLDESINRAGSSMSFGPGREGTMLATFLTGGAPVAFKQFCRVGL